MNSINSFIYKRFNLSLFFFLVSGFYGFLMRWQSIADVFSYNYMDVLQAHSHVAFLGWGFLSTITLITAIYLPVNKQIKKMLTYSFWIMAASIIGMLISFPLQGYKFFSIGFLTLFLLASYVYLYELCKSLKKNKKFSARFIKAGIFYYYLSSIGIWGLAIITVKIGRGDLYQNTINFYTHFLYNGYFVLTLFGLFFLYIEKKEFNVSYKYTKNFYYLTSSAVLPAFALSLLWKEVPNYVVVIGFIGALLQLVSLVYLWKIIVKVSENMRKGQFILRLVILVISLKIIMQFAGGFPSVTMVAMQYKPYFVIGYIHLFTLGFMSLFLFLLYKLLLNRKIQKWGISLFVLGIVSSEVLLFSQGFVVLLNKKTISIFNEIMLMASGLMLLGLSIVFIHQSLINKNQKS